MSTKERPILFSGLMVRAILEGRKTQTRRIVKCLVSDGAVFGVRPMIDEPGMWLYNGRVFPCPYGKPGDRLWVRETFSVCVDSNIFYKADGKPDPWDGIKWKPSIHMPRVASRITLEITGVRVEQLQDITNADCVAEGIEPIGDEQTIKGTGFTVQAGRLNDRYSTVRQLYSELWESINGPGAWNANPWVWVVEFKRLEATQ